MIKIKKIHHSKFTGYAENFESLLTKTIFSTIDCAISNRWNGSLW